MTDRTNITIIILILLVVLVVICYRTGDTFVAVLAYIDAIILLRRGGIAASAWLDKIEYKENNKPL